MDSLYKIFTHQEYEVLIEKYQYNLVPKYNTDCLPYLELNLFCCQKT